MALVLQDGNHMSLRDIGQFHEAWMIPRALGMGRRGIVAAVLKTNDMARVDRQTDEPNFIIKISQRAGAGQVGLVLSIES
jgi:hypothetical protein